MPGLDLPLAIHIERISEPEETCRYCSALVSCRVFVNPHGQSAVSEEGTSGATTRLGTLEKEKRWDSVPDFYILPRVSRYGIRVLQMPTVSGQFEATHSSLPNQLHGGAHVG